MSSPPASTPEPADPAAFLTAYRPRALELLRRYRIPVEDREDILHDVSLRCLEKWETLLEPRRWFFSTLKFASLLHLRERRERHAVLLAAAAEAVRNSSTAADATSARDFALAFDTILNGLPALCRTALDLRFRRGFKAGEIATVLSLTPLAVYRALDRCLAAFRRALQRP